MMSFRTGPGKLLPDCVDLFRFNVRFAGRFTPGGSFPLKMLPTP